MAYVYRHVRLDTNQVFYIGIGSGKNYSRAYRKTTRNQFWNRIVAKTNYRVDIIFDDLTWDEARIKEIEFISIYGRRDLGLGTLVNMTDGGDGCVNRVFTERQLESSKRRKTKEWRFKIAESNKGKIISYETRKKISESRIGKSMPDYVKEKISNSIKGENHPNFGKKASNETREKMSNRASNMSIEHKRKIANSRKRIIFDLSTGIFYFGLDDASCAINIGSSNLSKMLNGNHKNKTNMVYV